MDDIEASLLSSPDAAFDVGGENYQEMEWLCQTIYAVYLDGGLAGGMFRRGANVVGTVAVYLAFVSLACKPIDWAALGRRDEHFECPDGSLNTAPLTATDCYGQRPIDFGRLADMSGWCWTVTVLVIVYMAYQAIDVAFAIPELHFAHTYFQSTLKLPMVLSVPWSEVATKMSEVEGAPLDVLTQTNLITRRANWMVALYSNRLLDVPLDHLAPSTLCWCVERCLMSCCFDAKGRVAHDVRTDVDAAAATLRRMFRITGLVLLVLSPFVLIVRTLWIVLEMIDGARVVPTILSTRGVSMPEHYRLRHYSELDHEFAQRFRTLKEPAQRLFAHRRSPVMAAIARSISMVGAAAVLVLGIMAIVYDDPIVLAELVANRSVGWWLGVLGAVLVVTKPTAYPPIKYPVEVDTRSRAVDAVRAVLYPADQRWKQSYISTAAAVANLERTYQPRWRLAVFELIGVLYVPWALVCVLPSKARAIVRFVRDNNMSDTGGFCSAGYFVGADDEVGDCPSKLMASMARFKTLYHRRNQNHSSPDDHHGPSILIE